MWKKQQLGILLFIKYAKLMIFFFSVLVFGFGLKIDLNLTVSLKQLRIEATCWAM